MSTRSSSSPFASNDPCNAPRAGRIGAEACIETRRSRRRSILLSSLISSLLGSVVVLASATASAQDAPSNCPPGSWFCADAQEKPAPKAQPAAPSAPPPAPGSPRVEKLEPLPPAEALPPPVPAPPVIVYRPGPPGPYGPPPPPPVVVYQPPPPVYVVRPPSPPPPPYYFYRPRAKKTVLPEKSEWGVNLRFEGSPIGGGSQSTQPMLGTGFGMRYKPVPSFGLEAGFDFLNGHDYQNNVRHETEFSVNALVFLNPRSRVQLYLLAGLGGAWANVSGNDGFYESYDGGGSRSYTYFGGQAGGGLEFRIARHFAMNMDVRGFLRTRTDSGASSQPEFVSPSGQTTNTSDGALITGGMTFYW